MIVESATKALVMQCGILSFAASIEDVVSGAEVAANLPMQVFITFCLFVVAALVVYQERKRDLESRHRDLERKAWADAQEVRFKMVIEHHQNTVESFKTEREAFIRSLLENTDRSNSAISGMTHAIKALDQYMRDRDTLIHIEIQKMQRG